MKGYFREPWRDAETMPVRPSTWMAPGFDRNHPELAASRTEKALVKQWKKYGAI